MYVYINKQIIYYKIFDYIIKYLIIFIKLFTNDKQWDL